MVNTTQPAHPRQLCSQNLYRQADPKPDLEHRGLLQTISKADFKDTDVYLVRAATGELILKREGLEDRDIVQEPGPHQNRLFLKFLIPGPQAGNGQFFKSLTEWQTESGLQAGFIGGIQDGVDRLTPGETVQLVAINRKTGYLGLGTGQLKAGFEDAAGGGAATTGMLAVIIRDLRLMPPQLKISAERIRNDNEEYRIGFEGAGLTQDTLIKITTDWRGHGNVPIPSVIDGYTGRLAKIVERNVLSPEQVAGDHVGYFDIQPGTHQQVLKFQGDILGTEHFYVHVSGNHQYDTKDFAADDNAPGILKYRPKTYVPVQAAIPDVPAMRAIEQLGEHTGQDLDLQTLYHWRYRPEMQFSVFELDQLLFRQGEGDDANQYDLLNGALVDLNTEELAQLLYLLTSSAFDPLPLIGPMRELLLQLGQGIYPLCVPHSGSENTDCTAGSINLTPEEIEAILATGNGALMLSLYLNTDIANVLWEYNEPGLKVIFEVPGDAFSVKPEQSHPDAPGLYRVLGGYRLKYQLNLPSGARNPKYTWTFDQPGRFCDRYGIGSVAEPGEGCEATATKILEDGSNFVYWEPESWTTGLAAKGTVLAQYDVEGKPEKQKLEKTFFVQSRVLKPQDPPMEGEDVKMLEAMLWQLGLSPQRGYPGNEGNRIDSIRGNGNKTQACDGTTADERNTFYTGWSGCTNGYVSVEGMVKRFQARHNTPVSKGFAGASAINSQDGIVDDGTLKWLRNAWNSYWAAYDAHRSHPQIDTSHPEFPAWLEAAVAIWEEGNGSVIPASYTDAVHQDVLTQAGVSTSDPQYARSELLRDWAVKESATHWGKGFPATEYRMTEGGGDEYGSMSFNQVVYQYRYADSPCTVHKAADLNYLEPRENLMGFAVHTAGRTDVAVSCGGSFWRGFASGAQATRGLAENHTDNSLVGYLRSGTVIPIAANQREDDYEVLAKAIGLYNGAGTILAGNRTWSQILRDMKYPITTNADGEKVVEVKNDEASGKCFSCGYTINARNGSFELPYRTYVWVGARYPATQADGTPHPQAGEPEWCFAYGEKEWREPFTIEEPGRDPRPATYIDYLKQAKLDDSKKMECM